MKIIINYLKFEIYFKQKLSKFINGKSRADVPGWVLVVLMTTALVTGIWSIAAPKLTTILRNSLDAMGGIRQLRKFLSMKHPGSVESFLTIIPQLFIFLIMFQLIFMQFNSVKEMHLSQGALARVAILGDENDFIRYPLIGGGSVLLRENIINNRKFIDFNSLALRKSIAIAVDENIRD